MRRTRRSSQKKFIRRVATIITRVTKNRRFRYLRLIFFHRFSTLLIVSGILLLFYPLIRDNLFESPHRVTTTKSETVSDAYPVSYGPIRIADALTKGSVVAQPPTRIIIPSVRIDIPVTESKLVNGYWEVSETTASHGLGSAYPSQNGNTVIFAHARAGLFLSLRNIEISDWIYVLTNDRWHRYRVQKIVDVAPKDIQTIQPTENETLTLFTCSGFLDSKRLVVTALADR